MDNFRIKLGSHFAIRATLESINGVIIILSPAIYATLVATSLKVDSRIAIVVHLAHLNLYMDSRRALYVTLAHIRRGGGAPHAILVTLGLIRTNMVKLPVNHVHVKRIAAKTIVFHA